MIKSYAKSIVYIALAAVGFLVTATADNVISSEELLNLGVVVLGVIPVYSIPNLPNSFASVAKSGVAFLTAGLLALISFWTGGITVTEGLQILIAAFTAIGVYIIPNEK